MSCQSSNVLVFSLLEVRIYIKTMFLPFSICFSVVVIICHAPIKHVLTKMTTFSDDVLGVQQEHVLCCQALQRLERNLARVLEGLAAC